MARRRHLGRPVECLVDDRTGTAIVTFEVGVKRVYTRDEIAQYAVEVAEEVSDGDYQHDEGWLELISGIIGGEAWGELLATVKYIRPPKTPPGLVISQGRQHA